MPLFYFIFLVILNFRLVFAGDWQHYTMHNEFRDIVEDNKTLWLAMPWGIRSVSQNEKVDFTPGNNGLEAADFVQIFALPDGAIIAASSDGVLVRKNKGKNFETINRSFTEKKRQLLPSLGKRAGNILILPFNTAISFFDYEQKRSVITLEKVGSNPLGEFQVERIAVREDSIWVNLGANRIWKRTVKWDKISEDKGLADPYSWEKTDSIPFAEKPKPQCSTSKCTEGNIPLDKVEAIAVLQGKGAVAWGDFNANLSRKTGTSFGSAFPANSYSSSPINFGYTPRTNKSLAILGDGSFAIGFEGAGIYTYDSENKARWYNAKNDCLTGIKEGDDGWPTVHGLVAAPDSSGYIFSFVGIDSSGLGFLSKNGDIQCRLVGRTNAAGTVAVRENSDGEWEIYVSWANDLHNLVLGFGGVDSYIIRKKSTFAPEFVRRFSFDYGTPKDLSFDKDGNLWGVSSSRIFYKKINEYELKIPSIIKNFDGANLTSLEIDPQNNLWISSENDGAFKISMENNSMDSLIAKRFRIKDGLMNETIYDIAIDNVLGLVYFANGMGLSVYSTAEARNTDNYMENSAPKVIAFPNPFRPSIHKNVTIDNINEYAEVYIFNAAGRRVKFFKGGDLSGGRAIWDGTGENGKSVAPGVYHYFAVKGKNTAKGKILVER